MKIYQNKDWLSQKYSKEKLSMREIGKLCGVKDTTIFVWLKKFDIKIRTRSEARLETLKKYPHPWIGKRAWNRGKPGPNRRKYGKEAWSWKGGRIFVIGGYILKYAPSHSYANSRGYVREHRLIMEAHLGRTLMPTEAVHHINGIPDGNQIENLSLFSSRGKHSAFHNKNKKKRSQPREFYDKY